MRGWRAGAALAAVAVLLCGCASAGDQDGSGSWSAVIKATADQASSDAEREVLADGRITDAEYSELQGRIVDCLRGLGLKASFDADGALTYTKTSSAGIDRARIEACNADNGIRTLSLRDAMRRNPSHLDEGTIMVDCLRRVGLVDSAYTPEMFARGVDLARLSASPLFEGCDADPLHFRK